MNGAVSHLVLQQGSAMADDTVQKLPLVTAVLVCWNHERFVKAAVLSALQQTYSNIQLIVFDNASTDGSRKELESLRKQFDFELVFQENIGLVRTLNKALSMAKGEFFAVLSTDDIWLLDKTGSQVCYFLENPDVDLTFGATKTIDANGELVLDTKRRQPYLGDVRFDDLMAYGGSTSGPTVMCRTATLRAVGGYDEDLKIEDASLVYKLTKNGYRVVGLDKVLTLYRRHGGNWTIVQPIWPDICAIGKKYCRSKDEYRSFVRRCLRMEFRSLAGRNKIQALRLLFSEPIEWTFNDVGVGLVKLMLPRSVLDLRSKDSER